MFTVTLELPDKVVRIAENSKDAPGKPAVPLLDLRGSCKGIDTMDAYFEHKRADKALEDGERA